ncbi:MAG TPA: redoxin domain-containing protein [Planctomycetota bacterium]|nr:redoxin domain-containing protein [Planctomycetota bacterium]
MGAMQVSVGDRAPAFSATTWLGEGLDLESYLGRKLWLAFFRFATCPLANLRVHEICKRHDLSADGLQIVAVFPSPRERIAAHVGKQNPPFPLVSDPHERLYMLYGLRASVAGLIGRDVGLRTVQAAALGFLGGPTDGTITRLPGDFLIDEGGVVRHVHNGEDVADHIPFERVLEFTGRGTS